MAFDVPGRPVPKQRARRAPDGHWYTPKATVAYEDAVAWCAASAGFRPEPGAEYRVSIVFHVTAKRQDGDNLEKSVLDGLNKVEGFDDRQVVSCGWCRRFCQPGEERTVVEIEAV